MSIVLDVAIGVTFLYVLLALIATTVQELIATFLRLRARNLFEAVAGMLEGKIEGKPIVETFFEHPLIKNLCRSAPRFKGSKIVNSWELPSYIPARAFALALLDVLRGKETASEAVGARQVLLTAGVAVDNIEGNEDLKRALKLLVASAERQTNDLDVAASQVSERVETWFNDRMARASGWYKRQAQWLALVIASVISVAANASTFNVAEQLWNNENLRDAIVANAQAYHNSQGAPQRTGNVSSAPPVAPTAAASEPTAELQEEAATTDDVKVAAQSLTERVKALEDAKFPIGWTKRPKGFQGWLIAVLGWIVTAFAVSLGSNFWFDVLAKSLQIRGGGPKVSASTGRVVS